MWRTREFSIGSSNLNLFERMAARRQFAEDETQIIEQVKALCRDRIAPRAKDLDRSGEFPWHNIEDINGLGLNAMFIPEAYGGAGLSYACYLACVEHISEACAATGVIWATNFHAMKPLVDFGNEEQKSRLLPVIASGGIASLVITEAEAGSDALGMRTTFTDEGECIRIDGSKSFITNGNVADLYLVFGKWAAIDDPRAAISVLVMEKGSPGLNAGPPEDKLGVRGSNTVALTFDGCRVPKSNLLCEPGAGLRILLASLNKSRPSIAAHALGIAHAAFSDAVSYINERRQCGKKILEFQGIQFMIADLAAELALCESWLWNVAAMVDRGEPDFAIEASILKMRASDLAMRMTTDAVQLLGGYGYCKEYRVERLMRDAKITQIWEGTNQVHRQFIGRSFLKR